MDPKCKIKLQSFKDAKAKKMRKPGKICVEKVWALSVGKAFKKKRRNFMKTRPCTMYHCARFRRYP